MCHIFFIHLSIHGHLDFFHTLAIVNNVSAYMGVHISFWVSVFCFLWINTQKVELLHHIVVLFLILGGIPILFYIVAAPIYIPTNSAEKFPFPHILTNTCCFLLVINSNILIIKSGHTLIITCFSYFKFKKKTLLQGHSILDNGVISVVITGK